MGSCLVDEFTDLINIIELFILFEISAIQFFLDSVHDFESFFIKYLLWLYFLIEYTDFLAHFFVEFAFKVLQVFCDIR